MLKVKWWIFKTFRPATFKKRYTVENTVDVLLNSGRLV